MPHIIKRHGDPPEVKKYVNISKKKGENKQTQNIN